MIKRALLILGLPLLLTFATTGWAAPERPAVAPADSWEPLPGPAGGSVTALAISPAYGDDQTVFAGLRGEGIYRSSDGGNSWTATQAGAWAIVDLALSPAYGDDQTMFALAGTPITGYHVYRSADAGEAWEEVTATTSGHALAISPNFAHDKTIYLLTGTATPTYVSTDGGDTFTAAGGWFTTHDVTALAFSPAFATDNIAFAAVRDDALYRSTDGGATWSASGLAADVKAVAVSPDYANDSLVVAITVSGQVYRSTDGGKTWMRPPLTLSTGGKFTITFSPGFATDRLLLVASSTDPGPYRSTDRGASWDPTGWYDPATDYQGFVGGEVQDLVLAPVTNRGASGFAGTSAALYQTYNQGENWFQNGVPLNRLAVNSVAIAPGRPDRLLAGTGYFHEMRFDSGILGKWNGNLQLSEDGGQHWRDVSGNLQQVRQVAFSPNFPVDNTAFATSGTIGQHGFVAGGVYRSQDGGRNWTAVLDEFAYAGLAVSPDYAHDQTLWVGATSDQGSKGIYVSRDGGNTWQPLAESVSGQAIVPSPDYARDRTLFTGGDSGLYRSRDAGNSWTLLLDQPLTALALSPAYGAGRTLYAGTQLPGQPGALFRSADGGTTWEEVDTGMVASKNGEPITVSTLTFAADGSVLAGVHYGSLANAAILYRSVDGGETWQPVAGGVAASSLHTVGTAPVSSMNFYAGADTGLWEIRVLQGGPAEPGSWRSSGPRGGKAHTLAVSPAFARDGIAFSGEWLTNLQSTETGMGMIKSTDHGQTWYQADAGSEEVAYGSAVHDYAMSPAFSEDGTVFAATWGAVFKSEDQGETWAELPDASGGPFAAVTAIAVAPDYPTSSLVLAGSWGGLLHSDDGGDSWNRSAEVDGAGAIAFSPGFAADQTIFAGGADLYRTVDGGASWQQVLTGTIRSLALSPAFAIDDTLFVATASTFLRSIDGGNNWVSSTISSTTPTIYDLAISPETGNPASASSTLFAGTAAGLFRTDDGGQTWQPVVAYSGTPIHSLAISPEWPSHRVLLVGTSAGVYRYLGEDNPRQPTRGFLPLSSHSLAWSTEVNLLLAGTANHGVYGSTDWGQQWQPYGLQAGNTYHTYNNTAISPDYANDGTLFTSSLSGVSIGGTVYRSTDAGNSWEAVYSLDYIGDIEFSPAFASDDTVYASSGEGHVVRSTAGGDKGSWIELGIWPVDIQRGAAQEIELPPNYPADSTVFAAGSEGFWHLPSDSNTWQPALFGLGREFYVNDLEISPAFADDQTLLALAGSGRHLHYAVFRSTDGGAHWQQVGIGVPDVELNHLAFSPDFARDRTVYLTAADGGLYRSQDGGANWALAARVPERGFHDLVALSGNRVLVATDSGIWQYGSTTHEIMVNGTMEAGSGWTLPTTPYPARYTNTIVYAGRQALQVGIANDANDLAYSDAYQTLTIPDGMEATLHLHYYPVTGERIPAALDQLLARNRQQPAAGDLQYVLLYNADGSRRLQTLLADLSNAQGWQTITFDLSDYAGQTLRLYIGAYNDGAGGRTALYADDVSLFVSYPPAAYLPLLSGR